MEKPFDPEKIALAIVASSSYQKSIEDKIQLYMDAYDEACETLNMMKRDSQESDS